jgi:hypothetical protein
LQEVSNNAKRLFCIASNGKILCLGKAGIQKPKPSLPADFGQKLYHLCLIVEHPFCHRARALCVKQHLTGDEQGGEVEAEDHDVAAPDDLIDPQAEVIELRLDEPDGDDGHQTADQSKPHQQLRDYQGELGRAEIGGDPQPEGDESIDVVVS